MKVGTIGAAKALRTTDELRIGKSFGALLLISSEHPRSFGSATIKMYVETAKGNNIDIAKEGTPLSSFVALTAYGEGAIQKVGDKYYSRCELSSGSFELGDDDVCKMEIADLGEGASIDVHTMEFPEFSSDIAYLENKVFTTDEKERTFQTGDNDVVMITNVNIVRKVQFHWDNGITTDYEVPELRAMSMDADPIACIGGSDTSGVFSEDDIILPMVGVQAMTITKISGVVEVVYLDFEEIDNE